MPTHKIPRAHLEEDLKVLHREGERQVSISYEGDFALVETEWITIETRTVDGAA